MRHHGAGPRYALGGVLLALVGLGGALLTGCKTHSPDSAPTCSDGGAGGMAGGGGAGGAGGCLNPGGTSGTASAGSGGSGGTVGATSTGAGGNHGCAPILEATYQSISEAAGESYGGQNIHRFELAPDGSSVQRIVVRETIEPKDPQNDPVTLLKVWTGASAAVETYAIEPIITNPMTSMPAVLKHVTTPLPLNQIQPPIMPFMNDLALTCNDPESRDACMEQAGHVAMNDRIVDGVSCRDYALNGLIGYTICLANEGPACGFLQPVQLVGAQTTVTYSAIDSSDIADSLFALPTNCVPLQGGNGVELCDPP